MILSFAGNDPEAGWEPFIQWLRGEGLVAEDVKAIDVHTDAMTAEVTEYKRRLGKRYYNLSGEVAQSTRTVTVSALPPTHPSRKP